MRGKPNSKKTERARIPITGMTCTTCAATIEKGLAETAGIEQTRVNFASEKASIEYDPSKISLAKIKDTISQLGYGTAHRIVPARHEQRRKHRSCHLPERWIFWSLSRRIY